MVKGEKITMKKGELREFDDDVLQEDSVKICLKFGKLSERSIKKKKKSTVKEILKVDNNKDEEKIPEKKQKSSFDKEKK